MGARKPAANDLYLEPAISDLAHMAAVGVILTERLHEALCQTAARNGLTPREAVNAVSDEVDLLDWAVLQLNAMSIRLRELHSTDGLEAEIAQ